MIKKQLIMDKALELFAQRGFESTSVQQITEHCGISKGAFYLSFKSKDELILALIDHFMMQFTTNIDYKVKNTKDNEKLLYEFFYTIFHSFHQHSDFAKILIKEQAQSFNEEFILKMRYYDRLMEKVILSMIERLYGEEIKQIKYDLIYCIKGFMKTYSELFLFYNLPLDVDLLSQSLVEKTNLLAKHITIPFISSELVELFQQPINEDLKKEQIIETMEQKIKEMEEPIEKESLILLKQELLEPTLNPAIIKGLLENISSHPHCKWISYSLRNYFEF
ncbi:TetR/AcrR family transcriptional regulator [Lederbergia lenta]|uniref:Transcriptional regulator n=1 Tax=Lederbergia lenta TaxID=1467 RepID=A0A2X4W683_LEDLE|nr:TetR/AcrR family transcriptional regulator [Lederbergia lenta]MCM3112369.1 TetR/AcrR family transcriptional regulator [Lederbergia lenta]MEC2326588.1 TetR/AcrR family transcriptional regulator [Lederbergia lenta]SQI53120.1 transcriptional regulator [Lederbergia lenta]